MATQARCELCNSVGWAGIVHDEFDNEAFACEVCYKLIHKEW